MKKIFTNSSILILLILFVLQPIKAQYEAQSPYLINPDAIIPFITESADFWKNSADFVDGGFYTEVNQDGTPELTDRKSFVQCSRHAYGFSRAFMVSGDEEYLDYANHALTFLYEHGWDTQHGGWFFSSDKFGTPAPPYGAGWNPSESKWSFQQHYDVLGISAMSEATRAPLHLAWLDQAVLFNDSLLWDNREGFEGFYDTANLNWSNPRGKGFTPTVDGITTWVLSRALLTNEQEDIDRLIALADNIMDYIHQSMLLSQVNLGFAEVYDSDWNIDFNYTGASTGHVLKTAWCLARAYMLTQNPDYLEAAQFMIDDMMENGGYDFDNEGLYGDFDWSTGSVSTNKNHWMLEQGLTGGLINYFIATNDADRDVNLRVADGCLDFYMNHFIDETHGECYSETNATGTVTNNDKSDPFKGGYHNIEMAYHTYVYGNLFVKNEPISLYYRFEESTESRTFKMTPLAIMDDFLTISEIELGGQAYTSFEEEGRILTIPAGIGGIFKITYNPDGDPVATNSLIPDDSPIVFPNPANNHIYLDQLTASADITIFSMDGKLISSFHNVTNGERIDISNLATGIYLLRIHSNGKVFQEKLSKE